MVCGDNLYSTISQSINKNYLLLTDVPEFVDMNNSTFHLQYSDSFSGALLMTVNNYPFVTLENALNEVFHCLNYKSCLLTIGMSTVAIIMPFPGVCKVFDSHSRDLQGMPSMSGYCVLTSVEGIQNLAQYFHLTSQCSASNDYIPFELKGVTCVSIMDVTNDNVNGESVVSGNLESVASPGNREQRYAKLKEYNLRKIQKNQKNESSDKKQARLETERLRKKTKEKVNLMKTGSIDLLKQETLITTEKCREKMNLLKKKMPGFEKRQHQKEKSKKNESVEQREQRLAKMREYNDRRRAQRQNESPEEKKAQLEKRQHQTEKSKKNKSLEQREQRLAKMREYHSRRRAQRQNESPEEKKARLEKGHLQKECSKKDVSLKQRKQGLSLKPKENISNHESTDMQTLTESLIRNFHKSVSTGPLYICTCCDQLCYRHSVSTANQLTLKNPDVVKYLQNIVSVDNTKWVCQTCSGHLKKGKVPPCAIVNGMRFPTKPNFFYLNEL